MTFDTTYIEGREVRILWDDEEKLFTLYLASLGGPIISGPNLARAKRRFKEALGLSESIMKLQYFAEHGTFKGIIQ